MHVLRRLGSCALLRMNLSLLYPYIQIMQLRPRSSAGQIEHENVSTLDNLTDLSSRIAKCHYLRREYFWRLVSCTDYRLWVVSPKTGAKQHLKHRQVALDAADLGRHFAFWVTPHGRELDTAITQFRCAVGEVSE